MTQYERMEAGLVYDPGDKEIMAEQVPFQDRLWEFNQLKPSDIEKKQAYMKEVFRKHNIQTAKAFVMEALDMEAIKVMRYPMIVKPVDCNSSKGVKKVFNQGELEESFAQAVSFSRTNTALVEEFIEGDEISVDVYVEDGKAHILCVSNSEKIKDKEKFVIFRAIYPARVSEQLLQKIQDTAQKIADAFGLKNSPMLIQMISDGKDAYVLEFSARTGGGVKYLLIQRTSGFDVIKAVVDLTLGHKPKVKTNPPIARYIINDFIYCKKGIFDHLEGFDEMKSEGVLFDYYLFKWEGASFNGINSSGDRVAGFTIIADSEEELQRKHRIAVERLHVIDCDGNDIIRRDLLPDIHLK